MGFNAIETTVNSEYSDHVCLKRWLCNVQYVNIVYDLNCRLNYELWIAEFLLKGTGIWFQNSTGINENEQSWKRKYEKMGTRKLPQTCYPCQCLQWNISTKHFTSNFMINRGYRLGFLRLPTYILMKFVTQSFAVTSEINAALQSLANEHV